MVKGATATFNWSVKDGVVNYDTPGPGAKEKSYKTGRALAGDTGVLSSTAVTAGSGATGGRARHHRPAQQGRLCRD